MISLHITQQATDDLERLRQFLVSKNLLASEKSAKCIINGFRLLQKHPNIGRPIEGLNIEFREFIINFGASGYLVFYHFDGKHLSILAVRHLKENDYFT